MALMTSGFLRGDSKSASTFFVLFKETPAATYFGVEIGVAERECMLP